MENDFHVYWHRMNSTYYTVRKNNHGSILHFPGNSKLTGKAKMIVLCILVFFAKRKDLQTGLWIATVV